MNMISNMLMVMTVVIVCISLARATDEKTRYDRLYSTNIRKESKFIKSLMNLEMLKRYHMLLEMRLKEMNKPHMLNKMFTGSLIFVASSSVFMIFMKQYFLAICIPYILIKFLIYLLKILAKDAVEEIERTLPTAIDNIIRISSKYSDIRTILYEASINTSEPLASIFGDMSRKMMSTPPEEVLMEFAETYDNVWIYSFSLIFVSYMEDSNQEDTIKNLKNLRDMLERENFLMSKKVTENRIGVTVNYVLAVLAFIFFIINLTINPYGKEFFFRTIPGLIAFFIGMGTLLFTVVVNIKLMTQKK